MSGLPHIAEFLGLLDRIAARGNALDELKEIDVPQQLQRGPTALQRLLQALQLPIPADEVPPKAVPFDDMIAKWAKTKDPPTIHNMRNKCGVFSDWLQENVGHRDMARVTFSNGRDWRDDMIDEGRLAPGTIGNHIAFVKALFNYGADIYPDDFPSGNPITRVKYHPGDPEARDDFTTEERARILLTARKAPAHIYWLNWICSFHGCRNAEVADTTTRDFELVDRIWVFGISKKNRTKDQGLKTTVSRVGNSRDPTGFTCPTLMFDRPSSRTPPRSSPDGYVRFGTDSRPEGRWIRTLGPP